VSYSPKYTSAAKVEGVTQFATGAATDPSTTEVLTWIQEVEADADARGLYSYTETNQVMDVDPHLGFPAKNTIAWLEAIAGKRYEEIKNRLLIPPNLPIISITKLERNLADLTQAANWEELDEGPGANTSFVIIKKTSKTGEYLGFAIYFYQNPPSSGFARVRMTYIYGWNLSATILGEWCTLKVALKVFEAILEAETPAGASDVAVGDLRIGLDQIERRRSLTLKRIQEIEDQYFPAASLGLAFI